jgi:iron complex transport system substrate-binding protein
LLFFSCGGSHNDEHNAKSSYSRIISCAPSITETLFALSLGNKVVGVSDFCKFPPEVEKITKVGGYTNPNYEMIIRLKADLVILLQEHVSIVEFLKKKKIDYLIIDNHNLASILESFRQIGEKCGKTGKANELILGIKSEMNIDSLRKTSAPHVLLCVERDSPGSGKISGAYIAGSETFYNDLLNTAGMENIIIDSKIAYPQVSNEGFIATQPDIIIDIAMRSERIGLREGFNDWKSLPMVPAVKDSMVFCLSGDYLTIPGPRIVKILLEFKRILALYRQCHKAH